MGTVRLSHRGTKPQPTPRPFRIPSLAAVPLPPPRAVSRPFAHPPAEAAASNQPSAAPLDGRRHCPACCGRGLVTHAPIPLASLPRVRCAAAGPAPLCELARAGCDVNLPVSAGRRRLAVVPTGRAPLAPRFQSPMRPPSSPCLSFLSFFLFLFFL